MIVHPQFLCLEPPSADSDSHPRWKGGMKVNDDGVALYLAEFGRPVLPGLDGWSQLRLLKSGSLVCKTTAHLKTKDMQRAIGVYNCEHLAAVFSDREQDAVLLENILSSIISREQPSDRHVTLNIQIIQDVWREVHFENINKNRTYSIAVDGFDALTFGIISSAYEGFTVVRDLVIQHYEGWTASRTMCRSTTHWKSGGAKEADLKDKLCIDAESMCYPCAKRKADAIWNNLDTLDNDAGFDSIKPSTKSPRAPGFVPVPSGDEPLSPFAGGASTTSGSRRVRADGTVEIFDGKKWLREGHVISNVSTFASQIDEEQWSKFLAVRNQT